MSQQFPNQYQGGYPQQPQQQFQQQRETPPQQRPIQQQVKFYKSGFFGLSSAPGRFQRDIPTMARGGWRVGRVTHLGRNLLGQQTICVAYEQ